VGKKYQIKNCSHGNKVSKNGRFQKLFMIYKLFKFEKLFTWLNCFTRVKIIQTKKWPIFRKWFTE
jgi:hypothetical protein